MVVVSSAFSGEAWSLKECSRYLPETERRSTKSYHKAEEVVHDVTGDRMSLDSDAPSKDLMQSKEHW